MPDALRDTRRLGTATVRVGSSPLPERFYRRLVETRVEQSIHVPDRVTLRFQDHDLALLDADLLELGSEVEVSFESGAGSEVVAAGEVTHLAVEFDSLGQQALTVTALDPRHRLARGTKVRTFVKQSDGDVASTIARDHNLQADCDPTPDRHDYLLQHGTDFAFLSERARAVGFDWWVSAGTLHFKRRGGTRRGPTLTWGLNLRRFKLRLSASETVDEVVVRGWDPTAQRAIVADTPLTAVDPSLATDAPLAGAQLGGGRRSKAFRGRRTTGRVPVSSPKEAAAVADSLARRTATEQVVARGEALGDPALRAGTEVEVAKLGTKLSGRYLLTAVEHVITEGQGYVTRFEAGGAEARGLVDLLARPPGFGAGGFGTGLVIGVVTNTNDPERLGRVKVKFPTLSDEDESAWARVLSVGAGASRGLQMVPDVSDEVLVAFEHADTRRPIVLGGLWSPKNAKPDHPSKQAKRGAVWRSKAGHVLAMSDGDGPADRFVRIALADDRTALHLGEDRASLDTPKDLMISSDGRVVISAKGDLSIEADNITFTARRRGVTIQGARGGVDISSMTGPVRLAGRQAEVKGLASLKLDGGALTEVKGGVLKLN